MLGLLAYTAHWHLMSHNLHVWIKWPGVEVFKRIQNEKLTAIVLCQYSGRATRKTTTGLETNQINHSLSMERERKIVAELFLYCPLSPIILLLLWNAIAGLWMERAD